MQVLMNKRLACESEIFGLSCYASTIDSLSMRNCDRRICTLAKAFVVLQEFSPFYTETVAHVPGSTRQIIVTYDEHMARSGCFNT